MPIWLLPLLQLLPSLIQAISGALKSNPPGPNASSLEIAEHEKACDACDMMAAHANTLDEHFKNKNI